MVEGFQKSFRGGPAQRTPPDPNQWRLTAPKANTTDPLVVTFPTAMNYTLLQRMLQVSGAQGIIAGTITVAREETEWRFTPTAPWKAANYRLIVNSGIEDLAGNHIGQPFDIDIFEHVTEHITTDTVSVPFRIN